MPTTLEAVGLLVFVFLPGYLAAFLFERNTPRLQASQFNFALQILLWAAVVHTFAIPFTAPALRLLLADPASNMDSPVVVRAAIALLVGAPMFGALVAAATHERHLAALLSRVGLSRSDRMPTGWDHAFRPGVPGSWIVLHLRGVAEPVYGKLGRGSLMGVSPAPHDLFIEARCEMVDGDLRPVHNSAGLWVPADQVELIEFFKEQ